MRASIVIAAHNEGQGLWKTIRSCIESIGKLDCEILIADDASDDGSVEEATRRFPQLSVHRHEQRQGASPTKHMGASKSRGDVLVFLDGHSHPEPGAIERLIADVERLDGQSLVTPTILALDTQRWKNKDWQVGHGYQMELDTFDCRWLTLSSLRKTRCAGREFYESPAAIGCAFAVHRELYDDLRGFDPHMRIWGVEDLDFSLKCWLMGHAILHDPKCRIGHRFREKFDNYDVPVENILVNKLRMAYKNFTQAVWSQWVERCRSVHSAHLADHPEGLWGCAWASFQADLASADQERAFLHARRQRDEFWYAQRFALPWPHMEPVTTIISRAAMMEMQQQDRSPEPDGSPEPPSILLDLAGTIALDSPCKDLSLPGYPANSDDPINLKASLTLTNESADVYQYKFSHRVIDKKDCALLPNSRHSVSGEIASGQTLTGPSGPKLNQNIDNVPEGIYEYRVRVDVKRKDAEDFCLFILRSCLFKVGDPKLVGWTGIIIATSPCGQIEANRNVGSNEKARLQVLKDDPAHHQFTLTTEIWDRIAQKKIVDPSMEETVKPGITTDMHNPLVWIWPKSLYQHFVELQASSGRSLNGKDPCKGFEILQRIQCFFEAVE